jgi:hypothetical protein
VVTVHEVAELLAVGNRVCAAWEPSTQAGPALAWADRETTSRSGNCIATRDRGRGLAPSASPPSFDDLFGWHVKKFGKLPDGQITQRLEAVGGD